MTAMRSSLLLAPLLVVAFGCQSPQYQKYLEEHDTDQSTGGPSSGTTEPPVAESSSSTGASVSSSTHSATADDGDSTSTGPDAEGTTGSVTTAGTGDEGTTGSSAFCGDGILNREFEECDIPSPDPDGPCTATCQRSRLIFVLSISVNGKLSGLQGADAYCNSQAVMAKKADPSSPIDDPANFKALLSTSKQTVFERHFRGKGPYRLINGLTVSDSFDQLFTAPLQNPINVDEFGHTRTIPVWTGTASDGTPYPGIDFCADWTTSKGSGSVGFSNYTDAWWIEGIGNPTTDCYSDIALYCVEQQ